MSYYSSSASGSSYSSISLNQYLDELENCIRRFNGRAASRSNINNKLLWNIFDGIIYRYYKTLSFPMMYNTWGFDKVYFFPPGGLVTWNSPRVLKFNKQECLSIQDSHAYSSRILSASNVESHVRRNIEPPWDEMIVSHIKCLQEIGRENYVEAFKHHFVLVQSFTKILQSQKDENWALPIMYILCLDLRKIAIKADQQLDKKEKPNGMLEKGADLLMGFFRICVGDNRCATEDSKRWGILYLTNQLFKIYFKVNKLHLLKPLIRVIESSNLKDQYPISQKVTYKYFVGQQQMFQSNFKAAEENLAFAFLHCHKESKKNKQLILIFLITVKMVLGIMPTMALLRKYDLMQFAELVRAVRDGNIERFKRAILAHEDFFIKWGIRLVLEKLRIILYRNLFKKVYLLFQTHIIPISAFTAAMNFKKEEDVPENIEDDEVMCILSNLINENKMKGYISLQHMKVVLSKQNAFPPLSSAE